MAFAQDTKALRVVPPAAQPISRSNVVPFPAPRVLLPVTLTHESVDITRAQLATLLHSPLGIYVVHTHTVRNEIRVQFDIAREDLDFAMHTLIATLADAMIGPVTRCPCAVGAIRG